MSSTDVGDALEEEIFALFESEISKDRFWAKKDSCRLYRKKKYHSQDRKGSITFDIAIEVCLPGATEFSILVLIECKNYSHPVPVNDVEEFFAKIQQVAGVNAKGIFASNSSFQKAALQYAQSKRFGIIRYFGKGNFKWELKRSPSASATSLSAEHAARVELGLTQQEYHSQHFDVYGQSTRRCTNSLWDFFEDLIVDGSLRRDQLARMANPRSRLASQVEFLEKEDIEAAAASVLEKISYDEGEVPLSAICDEEHTRSGLRVMRSERIPESAFGDVLGKIVFDPLEIHLYPQRTPHRGRERFTLAHELGHHFLRHSRYMNCEIVQQSDLQRDLTQHVGPSDVDRLEWQANHFASCLLLPRFNCGKEFYRQVNALELRDKGFGALFVDKQRENLQNYYSVSGALMAKFGVSRSAVRHRLVGMGILTFSIAHSDATVIREDLDDWGQGESPNTLA